MGDWFIVGSELGLSWLSSQLTIFRLPLRKAKMKEAMTRFQARVGNRFSEVKEDFTNIDSCQQCLNWLMFHVH